FFIPQLVTTDTIVVSMAHDHKDYLRKEHSLESLLFNQLLGQSEDSILDAHEALSPEKFNSEQRMQYVRSTIGYIYQFIPLVVDKIIMDTTQSHRTVLAGRPVL